MSLPETRPRWHATVILLAVGVVSVVLAVPGLMSYYAVFRLQLAVDVDVVSALFGFAFAAYVVQAVAGLTAVAFCARATRAGYLVLAGFATTAALVSAAVNALIALVDPFVGGPPVILALVALALTAVVTTGRSGRQATSSAAETTSVLIR